MASNLAGDLGKTIAGSISKSLSGFGAGLKGAAIAGNPAVFGPALESIAKMMKSDQNQRQRDRAFEEEKSLEQRKLFTDILGEQKKTNQTLSDILKALLGLGKGDENSFLNFLKNLALAIAGAFAKGFDKLVKLFRGFLDLFKTKFDDILARFKSILRFLEDGLARLGKIVDFIGDVLRSLGDGLLRFLDFLKNLRVKFPSLDNLFKFFEDLPKRFGDFFRNLFDRFKKLPFIDDLIKFFSDLPNRFVGVFTGLLDTFRTAFDDFKARFRLPNFDDIVKSFDDFKARFKLPNFDDIIKAFDDFKARFRLPNFDDIIRGIEGIFDALPASFDRLRNATLINVAILADLLDEVKANIGAKFDTFKATFSDSFGKLGSYFDDLAIKFDSLRTSALESFNRVTAAFSDGRLALSLDDLGKIMPEILGGTGGFLESISAKLGYFYQTYVVETVQKGLKAMGDAIEAIKNSEVVRILGDIGKKLLKFLIPLDIILSIFDGLLVAFDEDKIGSIIDKNAIEVTFMDRVAAFLGGGLSSFFLGFVDIASQVLNYAISNIFGGGATWAESYNTGLQEVGTLYLTRLFENIFGFVKETFRLIGALFTFDGEGIKNAFNELYLIFDDFVVNLANFGMEILDKIGIRGLFIRMGNYIGKWWNDLSNSIGEGWFNAKKYIFGIVGKAIDASINFIGPAVVGMFNAISRGVNAVTSWVIDKISTLIGYIPGLGEVSKKVAEFGKTIQIQETKFEPYKSAATKAAEAMGKETFKGTTFTPTDENYVRDRDAVVSEKQRRDRDSAAERKRETRGVTTPTTTPVAPAAAPAILPGQSPVYKPTDLSNKPPPPSVRNNNPGNIRYDQSFTGPGGVLEGALPGQKGSFAVFATPEEGMRAMQRQIELDTQKRGKTLAQFIRKYAPDSENDTNAYIANMSRALGIGPNDVVPPHLIPQLQAAMIRMEGGAAASNYYANVQPGSGGSAFAFRPPSLITAGMPGQYGGGSRSSSPYDVGPILESARGSVGQGLFTGSFSGTIDGLDAPYVPSALSGGQFDTGFDPNFMQRTSTRGVGQNNTGTISGPEQAYIRNRTLLEQGVIDGIEARRPTTTAYTGKDADSRLIGLNTASNEMESQNLVYQEQLVTGVQQLNNQYKEQRKSLEMQFLGQVQSDISKAIYKSLGPAGIGVTGQQNSAAGAINQLYQSSFQNFATKILGKDMGPVYGNIFSQLAASYTDQFVNTVLGPMFGPNAAQGFNRAINNYAQGASVRKQYDMLKQDYNKMESDFKQLSSQVTLVDRLNALKPMTGKVSQEKMNLIQQIDTMEKALAQKGIQLGQAGKAKDANKKMVYEDLIFAMTGIPTGMRSMLGYEQGIQNFSQQMALMIGQPVSGLFGDSGGYQEYQRNVERQMKLGVDAQGRSMEQGALQVRDGMIYAGDYHNQGFGQVTNAHLMGYAQVTQMGLQGQAQILQQQAAMMQNMRFGGGGGPDFMSMLFSKGVDFLASSVFGGGTSSSTFNPASLPAYDDAGNMMPGFGINPESGQTYYNPYTTGPGGGPIAGYTSGVPGTTATASTGFVDTIGQGFKDVSQSVGNFFSDLFKPSKTSATGAGGTVPGYTGPGQPAIAPTFSFGDMLANFGGQFIGAKIGQKLGVSNSFGGMLIQAGINQTAGTILGNLMKGQSLTTGLGNVTGALSGVAQGMFSPQIGIGNMIGKLAGSKFMTNLSPGFAGSLGQFGTAFANPAIFGNSMSGGTLSSLPTSQLLGSLGGAALGGFSAYNMSKMLSGGYDVGGGALNKLAGIGTAAALLNIGGMSTAFAATGLGSALSGAAGLVGMGPLGLAILGVAVLGNRLFGRKAPQTTSQGITGTLGEGDGTSLQNYQDIFEKGGKFRSDKRYTNYSAADPELVKYMQASVNDVFGGVRQGAKIMGIDPNAITGFTQQIKLNMLGMSQEDQAKTLLNALKDFSDAMLGQAYPALAQFTLEGERLYETFTRLTQSTEFMNTAFEMLLYDAEDLAKTIGGKTGLDLANLKFQILSMFGGKDLQEQQDNFNKFVGDYYKLFYTQDEQLTFSLNQKKKQFEELEKEIKTKINIPGLNIEIPEFKGTVEESRAAYRQFIDDYVKNTGLATEDQRAIYAQLIQAAPMFYQGAQEFVELNKVQKKKKTTEELIAEGGALVGSMQAAAGSVGSGDFTGGFADTLQGVTSSLDYISTSFEGGPGNSLPQGTIVIDPVTGRQFEVGQMMTMDMATTEAYARAVRAYRAAAGAGTNTLVGGGSQQYLMEQGAALIKSFESGATNVNTVVDNSVRQVSSPVTTFVMQDDKVRDFHPILRNTERSSLRAFALAMR